MEAQQTVVSAQFELFLCNLVSRYNLKDTYSDGTGRFFTSFIRNIEEGFKASGTCLVCGLHDIKDRTKHLSSNSHRRIIACVELKIVLEVCQNQSWIEPFWLRAWLRLKDILSTERRRGGRLLDLDLVNWKDKYNAGNGHRGQGLDASKQWFIGFLSDLERLCSSPLDQSIAGVVNEICVVITELRQLPPRVAQVCHQSSMGRIYLDISYTSL
jgi:hypothetical protein